MEQTLLRYYITPDTEYNSSLWHVFDRVRQDHWRHDACVLSYAQEATARAECERLNDQEGGQTSKKDGTSY